MYAVNFPFIKKIKFFELSCLNDAKLNGKMKNEFLMFLNCRKYRYMHFVRNGDEKNPYCVLELRENILSVKANRELTEIFLDVIKKFENINFDNHVEFESNNFDSDD